MRKYQERLESQKRQDTDLSFYKEQISLLEKKNEMLNNKLKNYELGQNQQDQQNLQAKQGNKVLFARFEETNAALERAFERISILESENNRLMDCFNTEKLEKMKLQKDRDKLFDDQRKLHEEREKMEMEKVHTKEHLRVNNDHVERIKSEKLELERKVKQVTQMKSEMSKILDDERQVYKDSKRLFEDEIKTLRSSLANKVILIK